MAQIFLFSTATATVNYRASLNNASNKPSPVPTNTGNASIVLFMLND